MTPEDEDRATTVTTASPMKLPPLRLLLLQKRQCSHTDTTASSVAQFVISAPLINTTTATQAQGVQGESHIYGEPVELPHSVVSYDDMESFFKYELDWTNEGQYYSNHSVTNWNFILKHNCCSCRKNICSYSGPLKMYVRMCCVN